MNTHGIKEISRFNIPYARLNYALHFSCMKQKRCLINTIDIITRLLEIKRKGSFVFNQVKLQHVLQKVFDRQGLKLSFRTINTEDLG